jgi:hypothetical protein
MIVFMVGVARMIANIVILRGDLLAWRFVYRRVNRITFFEIASIFKAGSRLVPMQCQTQLSTSKD